MAYTPPAGNGVDFTLTGDAYTPPAGNAVDFSWDTGIRARMTWPCVITASAIQQVAFTGDGRLPFALSASANHQVAFGSGEFVPVLVGDARQQMASVAAVFPIYISSVAQAFAVGTQLATVSSGFKCVISGSAQVVYAPVVSQEFPFIGSAQANYIYSPSAAIVPEMIGNVFAYRPGYEASTAIEFPVTIVAEAKPGRVATAAGVFQMRIDGRTFRRFRASAHNRFVPIIEGIAE